MIQTLPARPCLKRPKSAKRDGSFLLMLPNDCNNHKDYDDYDNLTKLSLEAACNLAQYIEMLFLVNPYFPSVSWE